MHTGAQQYVKRDHAEVAGGECHLGPRGADGLATRFDEQVGAGDAEGVGLEACHAELHVAGAARFPCRLVDVVDQIRASCPSLCPPFAFLVPDLEQLRHLLTQALTSRQPIADSIGAGVPLEARQASTVESRLEPERAADSCS